MLRKYVKRLLAFKLISTPGDLESATNSALEYRWLFRCRSLERRSAVLLLRGAANPGVSPNIRQPIPCSITATPRRSRALGSPGMPPAARQGPRPGGRYGRHRARPGATSPRHQTVPATAASPPPGRSTQCCPRAAAAGEASLPRTQAREAAACRRADTPYTVIRRPSGDPAGAASQDASRPASKATAMRAIARPDRRCQADPASALTPTGSAGPEWPTARGRASRG